MSAAVLRRAVRAWLREYAPAGPVCVGLSGGADSLALAAASARERQTRALIVDHQLQEGSAEVAAAAAARALELGCESAQVLTVEVSGPGGMEAAARNARYEALGAARGGAPVLLGHTLDDQAESVLLGLARGSGPRSIRGMAPWRAPWGRPLLGVRRAETVEACAELRVGVYDDPHNLDPAFTRVRLRREVLPLLEEVLQGGVASALARTAAQLAEDADALDEMAADLHALGSDADEFEVAVLADQPAALRRRALRWWLLGSGVKALTDAQLRSVDALVDHWRGQGGVALAGGGPGARIVVGREHGRLCVQREQNGS